MKSHIIVDLDGTICDNAHRQHLAQSKQWDEFHSMIHLDGVHSDVVDIIYAISVAFPAVFVLGLTGRNERYRIPTEKHLSDHHVSYLIDHLLMRPDNNFESDHIIKIKLLEEYFGSRKKVLESVSFCLDDRASVVEALRNYGLRVLQVKEGDF